MSESSSENPKIRVNGEPEEEQQEEDHAAEEEDQMSLVDLEEEDRVTAEKETQAKMQSVFQQVRNQIRSQAGIRASKSGILELMQRVKDREMKMAQVNGECSSEDKEPADKKDLRQEELCEIFEKKLEASQRALRDEMEEKLSRVREEMQIYTDKALKDLECKILRQQPPPQPHQPESRGPDRKQRPSAPPSLASRRGKVLTRTMTTIIPKTCAPVILGPRARSETLTSSKGQSSRLVMQNPALSLQGNKPCQCRKPLLPPAYPPLHPSRKPVQKKGKTGN